MKAGKSVAWYLDRKQGAGQKWSTGTEIWFAAQDYMKKFKEDIDEAKKQGLKLKCQECGKVFTKQIGPKTVEVQCPKCKGFDVDVAEEVELDEWTVSDVEIAMKKKYGKVDKEAIAKLKKIQHRGNVDRNDLVKVGHGKLQVESN